MQNNDQRARGLQLRRHEGKHPQIARVRSEIADLDNAASNLRTRTATKLEQMLELRQSSQEIDIISKRHRQLPSREIREPQHAKIVAAPRNKKAVCCQSPAKRRD
jgi:hypothetical protein